MYDVIYENQYYSKFLCDEKKNCTPCLKEKHSETISSFGSFIEMFEQELSYYFSFDFCCC